MRRGGSRLLRIGISYHFPGLMADDSCQQLGALVPERAVCGGGKPLWPAPWKVALRQV